jgi:CheY-like chemotaxis protein
MQAVGQLTGGLAHDFNNLLTAVIGNLDLIRRRGGDAGIKRYADNAFKAAERGSRLTSQLLAFSRTQKFDVVPVNLNTLVTGMRELLNQTLGANVAIEIVTDPELPPALADANQLELAILNLAINARDAMPRGGTVKITTAPGDEGFVTVSVGDSGTGMPPEVIVRAFDPFFTTKPLGKGTGLGLSQVYGIAKQSGGDVTIASEVGKGTTVTLRLLPASHGAVSEREPDGDIQRARRSEKLLVVDDDPDVREIVGSFLSELGYDVTPVAHGEAAVTALGQSVPDLLVIDFAMPGMNGADTARIIRERYPRLPILFLSGFADSAALEAAVGAIPLLRKPFRPTELAAAVRAALDGAPLPRKRI